MEYKDYYKILGVERGADADAVKQAYRRLARKYHPDVSKEHDAEARFKEVREAYEVLHDADKRAAYDSLGANWRAGQNFTPPPGWEHAFRRGQGFGGGAFDFSDFFDTLFGGGSPGGFGQRGAGPGFGGGFGSGGFGGGEFRPGGFAGTERGSDGHLKVRISIGDAYRGAERTLRVQTAPGNGRNAAPGHTRTLKVKIPAGVVEGQRIRLSGLGAHGFGGGHPRDLYLEVQFEPDPVFRAEGKDVYVNLPITPWEAALGATVQVPTLGGPVDLKVPAGSQSGRKLRLKGRGLGGKSPGDQYAILQIVTPAADTEAARAFYRKMASELPFDPRRNP